MFWEDACGVGSAARRARGSSSRLRPLPACWAPPLGPFSPAELVRHYEVTLDPAVNVALRNHVCVLAVLFPQPGTHIDRGCALELRSSQRCGSALSVTLQDLFGQTKGTGALHERPKVAAPM